VVQSLVAVPAYHLQAGRIRGWELGGYGVPELYIECIGRAGGHGLVLPGLGGRDPSDALAPFAGLLLAGGGDVDPERYGQHPHPSVYGMDAERDEAEVGLACAAVERGLPVLAICRGVQVLNVALGGTLHQHLPDGEAWSAHGAPSDGGAVPHDVQVAAGTRLAAACHAEALVAMSHHHQGVDRLGDGLVATAWTADGLVEGVELSGPAWVVGVQWHPEMSAADDPAQQSLFDAFVDRLDRD